MQKRFGSAVKALCLFGFLVGVHAWSAEGDAKLKVATYNVGMLNVGSPVPLLEERQKVLKSAVKSFLDKNDVDVLAVQEAWPQASIQTLSSVHPDYVYLDSAPDQTSLLLEHKTGLGFLVKRSLKQSSGFIAFKTRESYVCGFGSVCDRGVQFVRFQLDAQEFFVLNSHFTPIYNMTVQRQSQVMELNQIKHSLAMQYPSSKIIVAADLNISPTFSEMREGDDGTVEDWKANAKLFSNLLEGFGVLECEDSFATAVDTDLIGLYTQDRDNNNLTSSSPATLVEPSQRLDHIVICSTKGSVEHEVTSYEHIFTERHALPSGQYELSDHYGIMVTLRL